MGWGSKLIRRLGGRGVGRWWTTPVGKDVHDSVFSTKDALHARHASRLQYLNAWHAMYMNREHASFQALGFFRDRRARFNVVKNAIDTLHSRITKHKPHPWVVTIGGDWDLQQRAKKTSKFLDGQFEQLDLHEVGADTFLDAEIYGTGALKFYAENDRPCVERVWVGELLIDPMEERYNHVRTLYQVRAMDRDVLAEMFPEHESAIVSSRSAESGAEIQVFGDLVEVIEAWHLRSGPHAEDGRHVITVSDATLLHEEWERSDFPFEFIHWSKDPRGFWGVGIAEAMSGSQTELNRIQATISDAYRLMVPSVWVEVGSKVAVEQLTNEVGAVYRYQGQPPLFHSPAPIAHEFIAERESLIDKSYALEGISQMSAQSQKPAGLNSGRALLVHQDVETERFARQAQAYERLYVGAAYKLVEIAEELAEHSDSAELEVTIGDDVLEVLRFSDVALRDNPYEIRVFPVSALSQTPQGKLQDVQEMQSLGLLTDPHEIRELLSFPDLDRSNSIESAGRELVDKRIEQALRGETVQGEPYMPLEYAHRRAVLTLALAQIEGASEDSLERLRNFAGHVETLIEQAKAKAQAEAQAAAMAQQQQMGPAPEQGAIGPAPESPMPPGAP